ncbi:Acetyltransferase (GNAT) domain-containing protein [Bizionia echini]|uniref:Acetyltransferase (GNAT) domain-containing protein n=1 Tax=Bizionia echini TaxID=649333 RepID=A0A1I5APW2_9FLAO|nr:GNAT family N-acetyltransferase [Bizionia echini]SFN64473.1 Acetyltransferase (GNAT) domain-containing protein [Bizionia echini]
MLDIIPFNKQYAEDFYALNIEWLQTHFYVEPFDEEVLSKPETYIINKGGHIFFIKNNSCVVATVALMPTNNQHVLELTKMAVLPRCRGQKIGQKLVAHCIEFAKKKEMKQLLLYSNTKLENAIYIYKKFGFKEIPVEANAPYKRGNIKMVLDL